MAIPNENRQDGPAEQQQQQKMANNNNNNSDNNNNSSNNLPFRILAVYKFVVPKLPADSLPQLKQDLERFCLLHQVRGSLLIAPEGINGTICYPPPHDDDNACQNEQDPVLDKLQSMFPGLRTRLSLSYEGHVFYRLKIKLKKEILSCHYRDDDGPTSGASGSGSDTCSSTICLDPTVQVGTYVPPGDQWNALLQDPDCLVVDARNDYEVRIGTFRNAQNPHTETFSELIPWLKDRLEQQRPRKIGMFCTGGIRCEKATAACLDLVQQYIASSSSEEEEEKKKNEENHNNNNNNTPIAVYHLEGGILAYLDAVPPEQSLFDGACYVFDQRVAVTHGLQPSRDYTQCHACRAPLSKAMGEQEGHPDFILGKQCTYCKNATTAKQQERFEGRQRQIQLAQQKGLLHIHDPKEKVLAVLAATAGGQQGGGNRSSSKGGVKT